MGVRMPWRSGGGGELSRMRVCRARGSQEMLCSGMESRSQIEAGCQLNVLQTDAPATAILRCEGRSSIAQVTLVVLLLLLILSAVLSR
jgi:hypothetical protein